MSRTRRKHGHDGVEEDGFTYEGAYSGRDKKPGWKPPKWWKEIRRRKERSRAKQQLHQGFEPEPVPHADTWDWN